MKYVNRTRHDVDIVRIDGGILTIPPSKDGDLELLPTIGDSEIVDGIVTYTVSYVLPGDLPRPEPDVTIIVSGKFLDAMVVAGADTRGYAAPGRTTDIAVGVGGLTIRACHALVKAPLPDRRELEEFVAMLDAIPGKDPEKAHAGADALLLSAVSAVHPDIAAAYRRVVTRCTWW